MWLWHWHKFQCFKPLNQRDTCPCDPCSTATSSTLPSPIEYKYVLPLHQDVVQSVWCQETVRKKNPSQLDIFKHLVLYKNNMKHKDIDLKKKKKKKHTDKERRRMFFSNNQIHLIQWFRDYFSSTLRGILSESLAVQPWQEMRGNRDGEQVATTKVKATLWTQDDTVQVFEKMIC